MGLQRVFIFMTLIAVVSLAFGSTREREQRRETGLLLSRVIRDYKDARGEPGQLKKLLLVEGSGIGPNPEPMKE